MFENGLLRMLVFHRSYPLTLLFPMFPSFSGPLYTGPLLWLDLFLVIGWANNKLSDYIKLVLDKPEAQISIIAPTAQAGATTWMFYPLVEGMGDNGQGLYLALCLSLT